MHHEYKKDARSFIQQFNLEQSNNAKAFTSILNNNANKYQGLNNINYANLRLWRTARSLQDINDLRSSIIFGKSQKNILLSGFLMVHQSNTDEVVDMG